MGDVLHAQLFDGVSARAQSVRVRRDGAELVAEGDAVHRWPFDAVRWPERTRHGQRVLALPDGARLHCADAEAFDAWAATLGRRDGLVVRLQRSWRGVAVAGVLLVATLAAVAWWGVPAAAHGVVALMPRSVDQTVGASARELIDRQWFKPSRVSPERQAALRRDFTELLRRAGADPAVPWRVEFRDGGKALGPNALALPDGSLFVTDALVELLADRPDVVMGVLAHEWGHVQHRHGMQGVVRASLVGAVASLVLGDFSTLLSAAPVLLVQMSYARGFEREADATCATLLRAGGVSPAVMVEFFQRVGAQGRTSDVPIAIASHPDHDERIRAFQAAARQPR